MSDLWNNKILPTINHPVLALHAALFLVINLGMLKLATTIFWQRRSDIESDLRLFASELSLVVFVVALVAGGIGIVYRLQGTPRPQATEGESFTQRMKRWGNDPFIMLDTGIYAVAFLGLIATILLMIEVSGFGPVSVWSWWARQLFYTLTGVLVLIAVRAVADAAGADTVAEQSAPSGAADEDPKEEDGTESDDESDSPKSESQDESKELGGPGFAQRVIARVSSPQQQLYYGAIAVAYLGLLYLVLNGWGRNESRPATIWENFFWELAIVIGGVGLIMLLARVVEVVTHTESDEVIDKTRSMANQLAARLKNPGMATLGVLFAIAASASAYGLINIWRVRNSPVLDFWAEVMWTTHLVVPAVMLPLVLWSLWKVIRSPEARASSSLLYDPYRLAGIAIFLIAYAGMIDFVLHAWDGRDNGPARIWDTAGEDLFNVAARVSIFVIVRAVIAALVLGDNPVAPATESSETESDEAAEPSPG